MKVENCVAELTRGDAFGHKVKKLEARCVVCSTEGLSFGGVRVTRTLLLLLLLLLSSLSFLFFLLLHRS